MRANDIRAMGDGDLVARRQTLKEEQMRMRFQLATNQVTSHADIRTNKKDIARINTILRERELEAIYEQAFGGQG